MSFLGGPECSTGANPLAQFQKQAGADTSLQRDRLTARQPPQLNGFRSQGPIGDDGAFQDFAAQQPGLSLPQMGEHMPPGDAFHLEQLRRETERMGGGGGGGPGWVGEFAAGQPQFAQDRFQPVQQRPFSPQDFQQFRQSQRASPVPNQTMTQSPVNSGLGYARPSMYGSPFGVMNRPMGFQSQQMWNQGQDQQQYDGKGKGRIQELSDTDWEKQFEALSTEDQEALDREAENAMEEELNGIDRSDKYDAFGDFENVWEGIRNETNVARDMLAEDEMAEQFGSKHQAFKDFDMSELNSEFGGFTQDYGRGPDLGHYMFEENNLFRDVPNAYEEGQKIMREGGNLSLAALAFEAAVQKQEDFVDAWVALGQAQAQNEKEAPAIRALEQALKLDANNLDALMGLSVSYTNEGYDSLAYRTLERWIGVKYPSLGIPTAGALGEEEDMGFTDRHALHEKVTNYFLEAAQLNPDGENVDVDVQVGLGVLFYGSEDYDKAVDCFTAALNSAHHGSLKREGEEHLLWNRLGATLANSGRSEEAIDAYSQALDIRANFVRARYNLGVSCINLGVLDQAAAHLLGALSMHRVMESEGRAKAAELLKDGHGNDVVDDAFVNNLLQQNQSTNLYDTLRRVFTQMSRRDLAEQVGPDMDLDRLRGEFDF